MPPWEQKTTIYKEDILDTIMRKLSSRKLWAALAGIVTGLAMVFGLDENTISTVAGAVVSIASVITYIMTEGKIDAASVKKAVEDTQKAAEAVSDGAGE